MQRDRQLWLVLMAMIMFAAGVAVYINGGNFNDHVLGGVAILGALAVVIANVAGGGKQ